jgi:hypothetical protein
MVKSPMLSTGLGRKNRRELSKKIKAQIFRPELARVLGAEARQLFHHPIAQDLYPVSS